MNKKRVEAIKASAHTTGENDDRKTYPKLFQPR